MKALIMIDSFKGTITSKELGQITYEELKKKNIESKYFPISDGGDGFLDAIEATKNIDKVSFKTVDAFYREIESYYLFDKENNLAYIELAKESGINLIKKEELNPYTASTFGLGIAIKEAIKMGCKTIALGIGGSATDDAGSGMLEALGVKFFDINNNLLTCLCNEKLKEVAKIELDDFNSLTKGIKFITMSDVINPLLGPKGATYVFAPQKGAKESDLMILEENIKIFSNVCINSFKEDYSCYKGSGAAGGVGFALNAFMKSEFRAGIDYLLDLIKENDLSEYDLIISGEGKIDSQSLDGKVISGIMKRFSDKKIIFVCAINELVNISYDVYSVCPTICNVEESLNNPKYYYRELASHLTDKYQGIIFDLDGTLLNTLDDLTDSINATIKGYTDKVITKDETKYIVGSGVDNLILNIINVTNINSELFSEIKEKYMDIYSKNKKNKTAPYEKIIDVLKYCKKKNIKTAVFSNKPDIYTQEVIKYYFDGLFDVVVGKKEGVEIKPSKEGAKPILDEFNLPLDKILYVGDTKVDMLTAINIGLKAVGALWGFRSYKELKENAATYIFSSPSDIIKLLGE